MRAEGVEKTGSNLYELQRGVISIVSGSRAKKTPTSVFLPHTISRCPRALTSYK